MSIAFNPALGFFCLYYELLQKNKITNVWSLFSKFQLFILSEIRFLNKKIAFSSYFSKVVFQRKYGHCLHVNPNICRA